MFPAHVLLTYLAACLIVVIAPGPDNILAISRGLSQGRGAAALSATGAGLGILFHTVAATLGLSLILHTTPWAFWAVKAAGGAYLIWLGVRALMARDLVSFEPGARQSLRKVFFTGLMSNVLNPKPGLFVLAFLPQFVSASRGSVAIQMLGYGAIFAVLTALIFTILGGSAARLAAWLKRHPRTGNGLNVGAGLTFIASGLSVLALKQRA